jgi:hypothetical protein
VAIQDRQLRTIPEFKLEGTPLMVNGVIYTTAGTRRAVIALDREDRRADLDAQPARGQARGGVAAPVVGTRRRLLDRRKGRLSASSTARPATASSS